MDIQPLQILFQLINFGIVVFVLMKFLYNPIAKVLKAREEKIKEGLEAAEKHVAEKSRLDSEIKLLLANAKKEAAKIVAEAKKKAEIESLEIMSKTKDTARKAGENERKAFEAMIKEAKEKAQKDLRELVTKTTAKVIREGLTKEEQYKLIENQINIIKQAKFD